MLIVLPEKYHDTDTFYTYHDNWYFVDTFDAIKITRNNNTVNWHTPRLKKTVQICFCQNFVKFSPIFIIFGRKMGKKAKIMWDALIFHRT